MTDFAIEHGHAEYGPEELLEQARANAQALLLGTVRFLGERGVPAAEWAAALGEAFGAGWGRVRPWDAAEFLDAMLTNYRALGAAVVSVRLGVEAAEATLGGFPDPELCAQLGVAPEAADAFHDVPAVIAAPRGLHWRWVREGDVVHVVVERTEAAAGENG